MRGLLETQAVTVRRGARPILQDCTMRAAPGALTAVMGPNGSGKSTLLRALAGLWPPYAGSVLIDGVSLRTLSRTEIARRVGFLPQDTRCDFAFTVEEMVAMGRHAHRGCAGEHTRGRLAIDRAMATCGVSDLRHRAADRLSGGERHRVAIARCLASEPRTLLLDEPTAHLDLQHALDIFALGRSLAESGHAVVIATHDLSGIARVATAGIVLSGGRLVAEGPVPEILTKELCRDVFGVERHDVSQDNERPILVFSSATIQARRSESVA